MPEISGHKVAVYYKELIPEWFPSLQAIQQKLHRDRKLDGYGMRRFPTGGFGGRLMIDFDTLPKHIQQSLGDPRTVGHILERYYRNNDEVSGFYHTFKRPNGSLNKNEISKYIVNANMCIALLELKEARIIQRLSQGGKVRSTKGVKSVDETIFNDSRTFNDLLLDKFGKAHTLPSKPIPFKRRLTAFENDGFVALIRDPEGKTAKNAEKNNAEVKALLNGLFSNEKKPTATKIYARYDAFLAGYVQVINKKTAEIYDPKQFKKLGKKTVTNFLASYKSTSGTYEKRPQDRATHITRTIPHHSMEKVKYAGSIISVDDRQAPFIYALAKGGNKRVWFYNALDVASGALTCFVHGKTKEGLITEFYRQLVRNYHDWNLNLPDGLECESSLNASFTKDSFLQNGALFQDVRVEANNPRGKIIERKFGDLRNDLEKERDGWRPRVNPKSEALQGNLQGPIQVIPYETIVNDCLLDIETWNNSPHESDPTISRWDYFIQNQHPNLKPTNYNAFLPMLGYYEKSSVNAGIVKFRSSEYLLAEQGEIVFDEKLMSIMEIIEGQAIDIYWLDANDGSVLKALVYQHKGDKLICELMKKPKGSRPTIESTPETKLGRQIMNRYQRSIIDYRRAQRDIIDDVVVIGSERKQVNQNFRIPGLKRLEDDVATSNKKPEVVEHKERELQDANYGTGLTGTFDI